MSKDGGDRGAAVRRGVAALTAIGLGSLLGGCTGAPAPTSPRARHVTIAPPAVAACTGAAMQLRPRRASGVLRRLYLPNALGDDDLLFDTGSARTFVFVSGDTDRGWSEGAATLALFGRQVDAPGRVVPAARRTLEPHVAGVLGADVLESPYSELDFRTAMLRIFDRCAPAPTPGSTSIPLEFVGGVPIVELEVDGKTTRLMFDTGTADLLLLRAEEPEGPTQEVHDAFGAPIRYVVRRAVVRWPSGLTQSVPAWLTAHHPAFERHQRELGIHLDGLLGLSALERARVIFRRPERRLEVVF